MNNRHGAQRKRMRKHRKNLVHEAGCTECSVKNHPDLMQEWVIEARNEGAKIPRRFWKYFPWNAGSTAEVDVRSHQPGAIEPWKSPFSWVDGDTPCAESWGCESAPCIVSAVPCSACGWGVLGMGTVVGTEHACRCGGGTYVIGDHWILSDPGRADSLTSPQ